MKGLPGLLGIGRVARGANTRVSFHQRRLGRLRCVPLTVRLADPRGHSSGHSRVQTEWVRESAHEGVRCQFDTKRPAGNLTGHHRA
jgi:hypothetical protein